MRRSTGWMVATSLLVATAISGTGAWASEAATRTTEIPGTGLAVRLPADWRVWSPSTDPEAVVIASDVPARQDCTFALVAGAASAESAAHETREMIVAHKQLELVAHTSLDVPAGTAARVSYRYRSAPDEDRFILHEYYITGPDGVASVLCSSDEPSADRWMSILASLELGGLDDSGPVPFEPRVEVPDHGFAVDFDPAWLVKAWAGPGPVLGGASEREGPLLEMSTAVLRAVTAEGGPTSAECFVEDATGVPGLPDADLPAEWQAAFLASSEAQRQKTSTPGVTTVDLVSGSAVRADWKRWLGMPATAWVFLDRERRIVLLCRAQEPPADGWRSIAESFEFLPEGSGTPR